MRAGRERRWDIIKSMPSVGVVLYHTEWDAFLLVRQFRPAVRGKHLLLPSHGKFSRKEVCMSAWTVASFRTDSHRRVTRNSLQHCRFIQRSVPLRKSQAMQPSPLRPDSHMKSAQG